MSPTVREKDGLALSSRNRYLSPGERRGADALSHTSWRARKGIAARQPIVQVMSEGWIAIEAAGFAVDHFEARHAESLRRVESVSDGPPHLLGRGASGARRG